MHACTAHGHEQVLVYTLACVGFNVAHKHDNFAVVMRFCIWTQVMVFPLLGIRPHTALKILSLHCIAYVLPLSLLNTPSPFPFLLPRPAELDVTARLELTQLAETLRATPTFTLLRFAPVEVR